MELLINYPIDYADDTRSLLGITTEELSDDEINSLIFAGKAEQDLIILMPNVKSVLEDTTTLEGIKINITIAFINLIAYHVYPSLKTKLLYSESDNKTIGTRFRDALSRDRNDFKSEAIKILLVNGIITNTDSYSRFSTVKPEIDIVTGNSNA